VIGEKEASRHAMSAQAVAGLEQRLRAGGAIVYLWDLDQDLAAVLGRRRSAS